MVAGNLCPMGAALAEIGLEAKPTLKLAANNH